MSSTHLDTRASVDAFRIPSNCAVSLNRRHLKFDDTVRSKERVALPNIWINFNLSKGSNLEPSDLFVFVYVYSSQNKSYRSAIGYS